MSELDEEKKFYERFYALMGDPFLRRLVDEIGVEVFRRSSVLEGFDEFLRTTHFKGECCMEIGTCNGLTAVVLARYFKKVISVDVAPSAMKHIVARSAKVDTRVHFIEVKDNAEKARVVSSFAFDAAYSDGDHARDTYTDFELVRKCGRVLFHEYWQTQPPVWNLVNSLARTGMVKTKGKFALWTA